MPVAVRERDDAARDVLGGLDVDLDLPRCRPDPHPLAVADTPDREVVGVREEGVARAPAGQPALVVQPRVVVALVSSTDEEEVVGRQPGSGTQRGEEAGQVVEDDVGVEVDPVVGRAEAPGQAWAQRPEVEAAGAGPGEPADREPGAAGAQEDVELAGRRRAQARLGLQRASREPAPQGRGAGGSGSISQSCRPPSSFGSSAGEKRAVSRTARTWKTRS